MKITKCFGKLRLYCFVENVKKSVLEMYLNKLKIINFRVEFIKILQKSSSQGIEYFLSKFFLKSPQELSLCENNILKTIPENSFLPVQQLLYGSKKAGYTTKTPRRRHIGIFRGDAIGVRKSLSNDNVCQLAQFNYISNQKFYTESEATKKLIFLELTFYRRRKDRSVESSIVTNAVI